MCRQNQAACNNACAHVMSSRHQLINLLAASRNIPTRNFLLRFSALGVQATKCTKWEMRRPVRTIKPKEDAPPFFPLSS